MAGGVSLGNAYGQVVIDGAAAVAGIGGVQRGLLGLQGGFLGVNPALAVFGVGLGAAAVAAGGFVAAIGTGVDKAADLQSQLSGVQALTGASAEEMDALRGVIDQLAIDPNLKVSAFEAADALEKLASNGVEVQDIVGGAARATVLLANAMGTDDFAGAATAATDVMALFGFRAEQMELAVNGITAVVNESKFEFGDYQLALAQAGGVAASVGVNFEDFNTSIAGISNLFASGSDAGTSFKTFLQRLVPASNEAEAAMRDLGIITADGQNQFFDANGQLRDMADISGILQGALAGLSDEQRNNALSTIFGTDAMRAAVGLANLGSDGFERLQTTMGQTSAADAAAARMNNLKGALEILQGVIESVQLRIGDEFIPLLTSLAQKATEFVGGNADAIVAFFARIASGATAGAAALGAAGDQVQTFAAVFSAAFSAGGGGLEGFINGLRAGLATIVPPEAMGQVEALLGAIRALAQYMAVGGQISGQFSAQLQAAWGPASALILDAINRIMVALGLGQSQVVTFGEVMGALGAGSLTAFKLVLDAIVIAVQLAAVVMQGWAVSIETLAVFWNSLAQAIGLTEEPLSVIDLALVAIGATFTAVKENTTAFIDEITRLAAGLVSLGGAITDPIGRVKELGGALADLAIPDWLESNSPTPLQVGIEGIGAAISGLPDLGQAFAVPANPTAANLAATAAPNARTAGGGGSSTTTMTIGDIIIQGASDPKATAAEVERKLQQMFNRATVGAVG